MANVPYRPYPDVEPAGIQRVPDEINLGSAPFDVRRESEMASRAGERPGVSTEQAGNMLAQHALTMQGLVNETNAKEADLQFANNIGNAFAGYLQMNGKDAAQGYAGFQQNLNDLYQQQRQSLGNPEARRMFDSAAVSRMSYLTTHAAIHAADQQKQWMLGTADARAAQAMRDGTNFRDDPDQVMQQINTGAAEAASKGDLLGWSPEQKANAAAVYKDRAYRQVIGAAMADDPLKAQALFGRVRDQMSGVEQEAVERQLRPHVMQREVDGWVQQRMGGTDGGPGMMPLWQRMMGVEGGLGPDGEGLISPAGAVGKAQVMPATAQAVAPTIGYQYDPERLRNDPVYENIGRAYFNQQYANYQNPMLAAAAYNAGPERVDQWLEQNGDLRTGEVSEQAWAASIPIKETRDYVRKVGAVGMGAAGAGVPTDHQPTPFPDEDKLVGLADQQFAGDPEMQAMAESRIRRAISLQRAATENQRRDLDRQVTDLRAASLDGDPVTIPDAAIRHLLPPSQAQQVIGDLKLDGYAGQTYKGLEWASPAEVQSTIDDLHSGTGPVSMRMRVLSGATLPGSGDDVADRALRDKLGERLVQRLTVRAAALNADPASFVARAPTVAPLAQAVAADPNDPGKLRAYTDASLSMQAQLGVPEAQRHVLTKDQADSLVRQFTAADPATSDVGGTLQAMAGQYGDHWNQAWDDMVTLGKIPQSYRTLAIIPNQQGRADFQGMLRLAAEKGGRSQLADLVPKVEATDLRNQVQQRMREFAATSWIPGAFGSPEVAAHIGSDVRDLAYSYAAAGMNGTLAADKAYQTIISDRYDFDGHQRMPKGMGAVVQQAESEMIGNLKPGDMGLAPDVMATPPPNGGAGPPVPGLNAAQRRDQMFNYIRRGNGYWVTNQVNDGAVFLGVSRDGNSAAIPLLANGKPIEIKWRDLRERTAAPSPPPSSMPLPEPMP